MKREEFLKALEERLQVLNRQEREDIVSEYRQHIELRMESGLTEEEAIGDFGDLDELVAEILDAYSVNPDYGKRQRMPGKESAKAAGEAVLAGTRKAGSAGMRAASALKGWILRVLKGAAGLAGRLWTLLRGGVSAVSRSLRPGRKMALEAQTWERREETFRGNLDTGEIPALREIPAPGQNPAPGGLPPGSPVHTGSGNGVCASSHGGCGFYGGSAVRRSAGALRHGLSGGRADGGSLWGNPQLHRPDSSGGRPFISGKKEQKTGGRPGLTAGTGRGGEST